MLVFPTSVIKLVKVNDCLQVKGAGLLDTRENCWKFFIDRVRRQLKVVLCFSPVGSTLRVRARKFPALVNSTAINWFHEWPQEALISVSNKFLRDLGVLSVSLLNHILLCLGYNHMVFALSINKTKNILLLL